MKTKVLGTAVAAALLGLSTLSFGQAQGPGNPTTPNSVNSVPNRSDPTPPTSEDRHSGNASVGGAASTAHCNTLAGMERDRCVREARPGQANTGAGNPSTPDSVNRLPNRSDPTPPRSEDRTSGTTPRR